MTPMMVAQRPFGKPAGQFTGISIKPGLLGGNFLRFRVFSPGGAKKDDGVFNAFFLKTGLGLFHFTKDTDASCLRAIEEW